MGSHLVYIAYLACLVGLVCIVVVSFALRAKPGIEQAKKQALREIDKRAEQAERRARQERLESSDEYSQVMAECLILQQKLDLLCEMLGVEIAADCATGDGQAKAVSIRDDGAFSNAQQYLDAVCAADRMLRAIEWRADRASRNAR